MRKYKHRNQNKRLASLSCCQKDTESDGSAVLSPLHLTNSSAHPISTRSSSFSHRRRICFFGISAIVTISSSLPPQVNALMIHNPNSTPRPPSRKENQALDLLSAARLLHQQRHRSQRNNDNEKSTAAEFDFDTNTSRHIQSLRRNSSWEKLFDDDHNNHHEVSLEQQDAFMSSRVEAHLPSLKTLRGSLGSEIPDMELHLQMEAARARARASVSASISGRRSQNSASAAEVATLAFMDLHHEKKGVSTIPSTIEKVAMSSLPSQLPGLATASLNNDALVASAAANPSLRRRSKAAQRSATTPKKTRNKSVQDDDSVVQMKGSNNGNGKINTRKSPGVNKPDKHHNRLDVKRIESKDISTIMATRRALELNSEQAKNTLDVPSTSTTPANKKQQKLNDSSSPTARVSHEQEIQLARIVQRGVELHRLKSTFEEEHGRDITRQEWTELAKLDSPRELRRIVSNYRKAKNKLVMANMGLVHAVVRSRLGVGRTGGNRQFATATDGTSYEELVQEGSLGLLRAAELFDPSRGLRFSTYATIWIKGILGNNNLSETIKLPLREKTKFNKIQKAITDIVTERGGDGNDLGRPTAGDIAERCELSMDEVEKVMTKMKRAKNVLSLDYRYDSYSRSGVQEEKYDALANDKNLMDDVDLVERLHVRADVIAALARNLDPREARLMRLRYGLNDGRTRSISDCAEAMGISRSKAQELAVGCLKKLREADDAESLQEYLLSVA